MPGLTDWFDVFKCGTHLDHSGTLRTINEDDIDRAISSYKSGSAPIVVGHPSLNAPAFGWIDGFRRVGQTVQARCSQAAEEFTDAVRRGLYKNRSLSFNADGTFRHVGFLGAAAPAVKGLSEIQFSEHGDFMTIEFAENNAESPKESAEEAASSNAEAQEPLNHADILKSTVDKLTLKVRELENRLSDEQTKRRRMEFAAYADGMINAGRLKQSAKQRLIDTMEQLHTNTNSADFADSENNALNTFKSFLNDILPQKRVEFAEFAVPEMQYKDTFNPSEVAVQARRMVDAEHAKGNIMTVSDAVNIIRSGGSNE